MSCSRHGRRWLAEMLSHGVTTVEAKSGYALDTTGELRLLCLAAQLGREGPVEIVPTFLGAHAVRARVPRSCPTPPRLTSPASSTSSFRQSPSRASRPRATSSARQASSTRTNRVGCSTRRSELGLAARLHADELRPSGGAELAAELGALSADHLGAISDAGIDALARAAEAGRPVVATLLPITSFYLDEPHFAPARRLVEAGVPVAVGTDFNPGTSPAPNAQLAMSFAVHRLRLSPAEALAALTINAAAALGLEQSHGSLEEGKHADLVVWKPDSYTLLPYWLGANLVRRSFKRGRIVYGAAPA